jgi:hypothetical protein
VYKRDLFGVFSNDADLGEETALQLSGGVSQVPLDVVHALQHHPIWEYKCGVVKV